MRMPSNLFTTAFKQQRLGLMFSIILVILVYLGTMAIAAQAVLARTAVTWGYHLQSRLTIEIPYTANEDVALKKEKLDRMLEALRGRPEVEEVKLVPENETYALLSNWIDDPNLLKSLPLPLLIDVSIKSGHDVNAESMRQSLTSINDVVQVYSHAEWMDQLMGFLTGLGVIASLMLVLTAFAVVIVISVICRAALAVQHDTIELLYFMGAPERSIAMEFQKHIRVLALPASLFGFTLALVTLGILVFLLSSLGGISLIAPLSWVTVGLMMALIPAGAILLSMVSARYSLTKHLRRLG